MADASFNCDDSAFGALLAEALALSANGEGRSIDAFRAAAQAAQRDGWQVLVAGLRSVGKSSFVCTLWGDAALLPTAVQDCTQTNTLIRAPNPGEADRGIYVEYLTRDEALDFAARGLAFYRLGQFLNETLGPLGPRLDEGPVEERLRAAIDATRKIFRERESLYVLNERLVDDLEELEKFFAFLESKSYRPGERAAVNWDDRREHLMGVRGEDGRKLDTGKQLAYRRVELARATERWHVAPPRVMDSPWIPTFHNARRAELIRGEAAVCDALVILALPEAFELEEWTVQALKERPELAQRTAVVFNQVDTVDAATLFARDGFAHAFRENAKRLAKYGIPEANLFVACARLPFLEESGVTGFLAERVERMKKILAQLAGQAQGRADEIFARRLKAACDPGDCGIATLRRHLEGWGGAEAAERRRRAALAALRKVDVFDLPEDARAAWNALRTRGAK